MKVMGEGNRDARIYIIGEAAGANEDKTGRPFSGGSGRMLEGMLIEAGIQRSECYLDNVIQVRPPKGNFDSYYTDKGRKTPTDDLLDAYKRFERDLEGHNPRVIVALGNEALRALTGKVGITKWRGSILPCKWGNAKVIPAVKPAMVMKQYQYRPVTVMDFARVKREAEIEGWTPYYNDNLIINPTFTMVMDTLEYIGKQEKVAFDIETTQNQILCMGFAWSKEDALCVPIFFGGSSWWNEAEELAIVKAMQKLFRNPKVKFIAQNAQFDMTFIKDLWDIDVANLWMDTMIAFHCVYPELRKGLDFLSSIYTNRPYHKGMVGKKGVDKGVTPDGLWKYNCLDCTTTWESAMAIQQEMEEFNTLKFYQEHSHRIIAPLMEMQRRGVKIDLAKRAKIDKEVEANIVEMQARLEKVVGHELNANSPKQMKAFLYDELNLPPQRDRATGNITTNSDALEYLSKKFDNPILLLILDIRKARKLLSTYIRAPLDSDGRIRCSYVITGTETGRLSSRGSIYGSGTNLQNIPRGELVRSIFLPDDGKQIINADLSQAEARVVAYVSGESRLQALFERDIDVYKYIGGFIFDKKPAEITKKERQLVKTVIHASHYRVGARTFAKTVGVPESDGRRLLNKYLSMFPSIKTWHMEVQEKMARTRILTTPYGRKRMFFARPGEALLREAIAYVPQSTVSDMLNLGIIRAYHNLPKDWDMIMQVHDSVMLQLPIGTDPMHIYKFIKHYFENSIEIKDRMCHIPVDIEVGPNWGNLKKLEVVI